MNHDIKKIVKELEELDDTKKTKDPGVAVTALLKKMSVDRPYTDEEM